MDCNNQTLSSGLPHGCNGGTITSMRDWMVADLIENVDEFNYEYAPVERTIADPSQNPKCPQCALGAACEYDSIKNGAVADAWNLTHYYSWGGQNFVTVLD